MKYVSSPAYEKRLGRMFQRHRRRELAAKRGAHGIPAALAGTPSTATMTEIRRDISGVLMDVEFRPVEITKNGHRVAVMISPCQWEGAKEQLSEGYKQQAQCWERVDT